MSFDSMVEAMRGEAEADGDEAELVAATQLRVRRSLESRARGRQRLIGVAAMLAILFVGTVSWALATGRVERLWRPEPVAPEPAGSLVEPSRPRPRRPIAAPAVPVLPVESVPEPVTAVSPEPVPALVAPVAVTAVRPPDEPAPAAPPAPVEALYRRAHELHFHGGDPAATLAAWDAYLAAEPDGRFAVEARYNRALTLIRLGRYAEARAALEPFARGEIDGGYRQAEAEQLAKRLARVR